MWRSLAWGLVLVLPALPARAYSFFEGRVELHGYFQSTWRGLSNNYSADNWYLSQWSNVLDLESEIALAPDGWGPFDLVAGFTRIEVRYECIYRGCGTTSWRYFGNRATRAPASNWAGGQDTGYSGLEEARDPIVIQGNSTKLLGVTSNPLLRQLLDFGATNLEATFAPVGDDLFSWKKIDTSLPKNGNFQLGPWRPRSRVKANRKLHSVPDPTSALPLRPAVPDSDPDARAAQGLFVPSEALSRRFGSFDTLDVNFSQTELEWNHGAGQDEGELKELYLDLEMLDSRLWIRLGKQNIVWGKTELFRTTDQFNPQDLALASLPSLEESRLPLWSVRGVWSFYEVGPLEDVRLELAMNYDDFEPIDLGRCGEPYTVWLVCGKSGGALAHGLLGLGLAGEQRPPDAWDDASGLEVGARLEWRYQRFSFALTDFWGYDDAPYVEAFNYYERRVDPTTGRPLDSLGNPLVPGNALTLHPSNRQSFDVVCSATVGVATLLGDAFADPCLLDIANENTINLFKAIAGDPNPEVIDPDDPLEPTVAAFLSNLFVGNQVAAGLAPVLAPGATFRMLNPDPCDGLLADCTTPGPQPNVFFSGGDLAMGTPGPIPTLNTLTTPFQQALLGCGEFYGTNCELDGIDLFNSEGSVLLQSFPQIDEDPPVATRFVDGRVVILPGARGPGDAGYDPLVDGCVDPAADPACAGATLLTNPLTGEPFQNELAAVSYNFMIFLAALSTDPECDLDDPITCRTERAGLAVAGIQRPELRAAGNGRFGRRDWIWQGGGEAVLRYDKRNVLGFSMDFAEDRTKTNWGVEFTWIDDDVFGSDTNRSRHQEADAYNLTLSVDRPTFVNFLNANRTFFLNSQWFFGYVDGYDSSFPGNGPWNVLATFTVATGYFQDRLLPSTTVVHDFQSASGGAILQVGYRFTEVFSVGFGAAVFYGGPQHQRVPFHQLAIANQGPGYRARIAYNGLSPIAERDELFLTVRYTF